ncbi:hypothetical protein [Paenibacillus sp.]|uniref:hypothetical protein n=1 Tax=Paenibacillus sp. TaxID=58172 RepID=UPI002D60CC80|nr:hypothetical protein [Paenibacillus sp.]HZG87374.1 hypothetical protein [Paenibacillus sp.]
MQWTKLTVNTLVALSLLQSISVVRPSVTEAAVTEQVPVSSQQVQLNSTSTFRIHDVQVLMQEQGKVLSFTAAITNNGNVSLDLMDYWVKVRNKAGAKFQPKLIKADESKREVAPKTTTYLTYYAVIDTKTNISDIVFDVIAWDFSVANFERTLGTIGQIPNSQVKTPEYKARVMAYDGANLRAALKGHLVTSDTASVNVTLQFLLENVSLRSMNLNNLQFYIQTDDMSVYTVTTTTNEMTLEPKERKIVPLQASIPINIAKQPLTLIVAKKGTDETTIVPIGAFALPKIESSTPAKVGQTVPIYIDGQIMESQTRAAFINQGSATKSIMIPFSLKNTGAVPVNAANLSFYAETAAGVQYPLKASETVTTLFPNIQQDYTLTGEIPSTYSAEDLRLIVKNAASQNGKGIAIGMYGISGQTANGNEGGGAVYSHSAYDVRLTAIHRVPDGEDDMLVAELTVTNKTNAPISIPNLSGYFMADSVKLDGTKATVDSKITVPAQGTYELAVFANLPYSSEIASIAFVLTEAVSAEQSKVLSQLSGTIVPLGRQSTNVSYPILTTGNKANVKVVDTVVNESEDGKSFYGVFELTNQEKRTASVAQLGGYLIDGNETTASLSFTKVDSKISPNGKALYAAFGNLPNEFDLNNFQMVVGQSVAVGTGDTAKQVLYKPTGYRVAVESSINTTLKDIYIGGSTLSLDTIITNLNLENSTVYKGFDLKFNYTLTHDDSYEFIPSDQKVIFEVVDQLTNKATYSKEYALKGTTNALSEGTRIPLTITFEDDQIMRKISSFQTYKLNVYLSHEGNKVLVASKQLRWFYTETLN